MLYKLKIDIDNKRDPKHLAKQITKRLDFIERYARISVVDIEAYESKHGYHVIFTIDADTMFDEKDITFLQLCLGSDWRREIFNWMRSRAENKVPHWNILFTVKMNTMFFKEVTERAELIQNYLLEYIKKNKKIE